MFLLHELQEGRHVRPAEVVDGFEAREHGALRQSLEVVLADVLGEPFLLLFIFIIIIYTIIFFHVLGKKFTLFYYLYLLLFFM